jgi:hypothetical protein
MSLWTNPGRTRPNKTLRAVLTVAMLVQMAACREQSDQPAQVQPTQAGVTVFSATLRQALAQRAQVLTAKRTALPFSDGATADSCATYVHARNAGAQIAETVDAQLVASEYLICEAVDLLPAREAAVGKTPDKLGARLATQLDLRSFPSSLGPQLDTERYTLAALSNALKTDDVAATLEDESSTIRFEVAAEADLNGDGKQDWIVWMADESRDGNYRGYATLVIDDATAAGPLKGKVYPGAG